MLARISHQPFMNFMLQLLHQGMQPPTESSSLEFCPQAVRLGVVYSMFHTYLINHSHEAVIVLVVAIVTHQWLCIFWCSTYDINHNLLKGQTEENVTRR